MLKFLRGLAIMALATMILIEGSQVLSLGLFDTTLAVAALLSISLTGAATLAFYGIAAAVCVPLNMRPGILLQTVFGTIAGGIALLLAGFLVPAIVLLHGVTVCLACAFVNTMIIWFLGACFGIIRPDLKFLPHREPQRRT